MQGGSCNHASCVTIPAPQMISVDRAERVHLSARGGVCTSYAGETTPASAMAMWEQVLIVVPSTSATCCTPLYYYSIRFNESSVAPHVQLREQRKCVAPSKHLWPVLQRCSLSTAYPAVEARATPPTEEAGAVGRGTKCPLIPPATYSLSRMSRCREVSRNARVTSLGPRTPVSLQLIKCNSRGTRLVAAVHIGR